ncbi:MAG: PD-(D/E)XK nuclease family protein [Patescibacteria group bacterium]|jgi:hypothetical protein
MSKDGRVWLSHTSIDLLERCPKCFWLSINKKIRQPEGIQSRLAGRFDRVIKNYFDKYRAKDELPPLISTELSGVLQNPFQETYFYQHNAKYGFYGKLDECLVEKGGLYVPIDFKTASSDPREKEILGAYQHQMDEYVFLLQKNRLKTTGYGYLIFFYPDMSEVIHNGFPMVVKIQKVEAKPEEVESRINNAISILENDIPESNSECPFCNWMQEASTFYKIKVKDGNN